MSTETADKSWHSHYTKPTVETCQRTSIVAGWISTCRWNCHKTWHLTFSQTMGDASLKPHLTSWDCHYKQNPVHRWPEADLKSGLVQNSVFIVETSKRKRRVRVCMLEIITYCTMEAAHFEWLTREMIRCSRVGGVDLTQCRRGPLLTSAVLSSTTLFPSVWVCVCLRNQPFPFSNNQWWFLRITTWLRNKYIKCIYFLFLGWFLLWLSSTALFSFQRLLFEPPDSELRLIFPPRL